MGAALLLVRHLIWCADQIRYFAGARARPAATGPWDLMRCGGAGLVPAGRQRRMGGRRWSGVPWPATPQLAPKPPATGSPFAPPDAVAAAPLAGVFALRARTPKSRFCKRGSLNVSFAPKATELLRHQILRRLIKSTPRRPGRFK